MHHLHCHPQRQPCLEHNPQKKPRGKAAPPCGDKRTNSTVAEKAKQQKLPTKPKTHGGNEDRDGALVCVDHDRVVVLQEGDGAAGLRLRGDVSDDKSGGKRNKKNDPRERERATNVGNTVAPKRKQPLYNESGSSVTGDPKP